MGVGRSIHSHRVDDEVDVELGIRTTPPGHLTPPGPAQHSIVSTAHIDRAVERFMRDFNINSPFLPDFVERRIYKNVLHLVMTIAQETLDGSRIRLFGHVLRFNMEPDAETN